MALVIGMDEAGYGPNLGPLIVGATAWEVPGDPRECDIWQAFAGIVSQEPAGDGSHIQIADSKQVYSPARGLEPLEQSLLHALQLYRLCAQELCDTAGWGSMPRTFRELVQQVALPSPAALAAEPWFDGAELELPVGVPLPLARAWYERCQSQQVVLKTLKADVVLTRRYNQLTQSHDSKGRALTEVSMQLLRQVWDECDGPSHNHVLILADKHGGRNRYQEFLPIVFGDQFIRCLRESGESSRYAVGQAEIRFETKSERHLPVALASMLCKYLRELSMRLFNRYWCERLPGLKPTAGYPLDARRFREDIAGLPAQLGISETDLWRAR